MNDLTGKEWLQNSFSIWRDVCKTQEEKKLKHPASFSVSLCEKLIKTFSLHNSIVLDPFDGIGTTMRACANLGHKGVGIDLSEKYTKIANDRIGNATDIGLIVGDNRDEMHKFKEETFDLCITSPPYWDILNMKHSVDKRETQNYSDKSNDIGNISSYNSFLNSLKIVFTEVYRLLKHDRYCLVNVMDIRKRDKFYPFHSDLADKLKEIGFIFDDIIIWDRQREYNNMRPLGYPYRFRINRIHEYILIFLKK
ncbi:MAG: site-specific DNA-methyltransferase [Prevotella sp.]|nr:site-specific DNA-methyltransferase [Prevotella sp.]